MELYREIEEKLCAWKSSSDRRPLILEGARQVGKTWVMKKFGRNNYSKVAYFNFDDMPELAKEFELTKSPARLLDILALYCGFEITPYDTLIIFDEVQECKPALNSLKYFNEDAPDYNIMAAGSLLGVAMSRGGTFPVGQVDFLRMYPLSFKEFLRSSDHTVYDYVQSLTSVEKLPEIIFNKLRMEYRRYLICGGMPKAVLAMLGSGGIEAVDKVLADILHSYTLDFSKHAPSAVVPKISEIWRSLPSQLAKENRKFIYRLVRPGARAREYEDALLWLQQAGLIYRVNCCTTPMMPLIAYDDVSAFKIYVFDVGILRALSQLPANIFLEENSMFREFKGAFMENSVLQALVPQFQVMPRYWVSSGKAEIDFLLQVGMDVIPVEVKAESNTSGKSLSVYIGKYSPPYALIISGANVSADSRIIHIPHPLADWIASLLHI